MFKKKFKAYLKENGLSFTSSRQNFFELIMSINSHFDTEDLIEMAKDRNFNLSRATIYRTIPLMIEAGVLKKSFRCHQTEHYEKNSNEVSHIHLVCCKCHNVIEETSKDIKNLIAEITAKNDFKQNSYSIEIKGVCKKCREK